MGWEKYCRRENWHPDANLLPLMDDQALAVLAEDIEKHGVQEPVMLFENKVLDGRNRLRACKLKGLRLTSEHFETFQPNGLSSREFVFTRNLRRRHLTIDQRAALAAELVPIFRQDASKRVGGRPRKSEKPSAKLRGVSGKAAEHAARFVGNGGVSARYVELVLALEKKKHGTLQRIKSGKISIQEAKREVDALYAPRPLTEQFVAPAYTTLDARQGYWMKRKQHWERQGIPRMGHNEQLHGGGFSSFGHKQQAYSDTSAFDPVLAEFVYRNFCPKGGTVLDPFAGECVKGIVAAKLGLDYTGIELREKQVEQNRAQAKRAGVRPKWIVGDSSETSSLVAAKSQFDLVFTSPPYYDLEIYSKHERDGSAFESYGKFLLWYEFIFQQAMERLKPNRFLVVKVGEIRDQTGFNRNFVGDNISCFLRLGLKYYNEAILLMPLGSAALRVRGQFPNYRKLVHTHQNVLFFFKGDDDKVIPKELGVLDGYIQSKPEPQYSLPAKAANTATVPVRISAASARLKFQGCDPDYIRNVCHGRCCESKTSPTGTGTMIPVSALEQPKIEARGAHVNNGLIQPRPGEQHCPFKTSEGFCELHGSGDKPFGCIASPFMLNSNDTLIIRNRYKMMNCRLKDGRTPAYKVFRASLDQFFGKEEAERICNHLDNPRSGDIEGQMLRSAYEIHKGNETNLIRS